MTCLTAHIFLDLEVRERSTVHLVFTIETNPLSKTVFKAQLAPCLTTSTGGWLSSCWYPHCHGMGIWNAPCNAVALVPVPRDHTSICRYHSLSAFPISLRSPPWASPGALPKRSSGRGFPNTLYNSLVRLVFSLRALPTASSSSLLWLRFLSCY